MSVRTKSDFKGFKPIGAVITDPFEGRNVLICGLCRNNLREACFEECQPKKDYHKLDPIEDGRLPKVRFKDTLTWSRFEKWAFTFLAAYYFSIREGNYRYSEKERTRQDSI